MIGVVDETLVLRTEGVVNAYDLTTEAHGLSGDLLWARPLEESETVLGAGENGVLSLQETGQGEEVQHWLAVSDVRDGTKVERLGTVPDVDDARPTKALPVRYLAGDLLITLTDAALRARRIPTHGG